MSEKIDPASIHAQGIELLKQNKLPEAAERFTEVLKRKPNHSGAIHYYGIVLSRLQRFKEALPWIEKSIKLRPDVAEYRHNLGPAFRALGRFEDAERTYRKALELKPNYAEAWFNISAVKRFTDDESAMPAIERLLAKTDLSHLEREFLQFAAGKICDDQGDYDKAFTHYQKGNQLSGYVFDREDHTRLIQRIKAVFSKAQLDEYAEKNLGCDSEEPVFIVGMPRSGTTLVEQILSSHPEIEGAGELSDIISISTSLPQNTTGGGVYPECTTSLPDVAFEGFGRFYLSRREKLRKSETRRIVDKMPSNFLHVGLIQAIFPKARIIHCVRDPRDTCLSCFFHRFRVGHYYAADLADLGYYYRLQEGLMRYWKSMMPSKIFTLKYEELIKSPEQVSQDLVAFCGVDWDEACLRFYENKRAVTTASNFQVRRPINRKGIARWKRYESHLGPLLQSLEEFASLADQ